MVFLVETALIAEDWDTRRDNAQAVNDRGTERDLQRRWTPDEDAAIYVETLVTTLHAAWRSAASVNKRQSQRFKTQYDRSHLNPLNIQNTGKPDKQRSNQRSSIQSDRSTMDNPSHSRQQEEETSPSAQFVGPSADRESIVLATEQSADEPMDVTTSERGASTPLSALSPISELLATPPAIAHEPREPLELSEEALLASDPESQHSHAPSLKSMECSQSGRQQSPSNCSSTTDSSSSSSLDHSPPHAPSGFSTAEVRDGDLAVAPFPARHCDM